MAAMSLASWMAVFRHHQSFALLRVSCLCQPVIAVVSPLTAGISPLTVSRWCRTTTPSSSWSNTLDTYVLCSADFRVWLVVISCSVKSLVNGCSCWLDWPLSRSCPQVCHAVEDILVPLIPLRRPVRRLLLKPADQALRRTAVNRLSSATKPR